MSRSFQALYRAGKALEVLVAQDSAGDKVTDALNESPPNCPIATEKVANEPTQLRVRTPMP